MPIIVGTAFAAPSVCYRTTRWCRPSRSCGRARNRCKRHGRPEDPSFKNRMKFRWSFTVCIRFVLQHSVVTQCCLDRRTAELRFWNDTKMSCRETTPEMNLAALWPFESLPFGHSIATSNEAGRKSFRSTKFPSPKSFGSQWSWPQTTFGGGSIPEKCMK